MGYITYGKVLINEGAIYHIMPGSSSISTSGGNYLIIICSYLNYLKTQQLFDNCLIII